MSLTPNNLAIKLARIVKNDEFYTGYETIAEELIAYKKSLRGKVVYCNADDYRTSKFYKYFKDNFKEYGLKKLIASCYVNRERGLFECGDELKEEKAYKAEYDGEVERVEELEGDGSFDSEELRTAYMEADCIITNPPFSVFRKYFNFLLTYKKKYLLIAHIHAGTYVAVFNEWKNGRLHFGSRGRYVRINFLLPKGVEIAGMKKIGDDNYKTQSCFWISNIPAKREEKHLKLEKKYDKRKYKKYDKEDAIECKYIKDIPYGYDGWMGVPVTIINHYNPKEIELLKIESPSIDGEDVFKRIFIRLKQGAFRR